MGKFTRIPCLRGFLVDTNISVERYWELRPVIMGAARKDTGVIVDLLVGIGDKANAPACYLSVV